MLKQITVANKTYLLDDNLYSNCIEFKKRHVLKWDNVLIVDGMEGIGKSTSLAFPIAWTLSGLPLRVVFNIQQFNQEYDEAQPGECIIFDEFVTAGLSTAAMTQIQKSIIEKLTMGRKKRVYIILVIPSFYMLRKYFAVHRSISLIHAFSEDLMSRGHFSFFGYNSKKNLYLHYRKYESYPMRKSGFIGNYPKYNDNTFISEKYYQDKKDEAIRMAGKIEKEEKEDKPTKLYKKLFIIDVMKKRELKYTTKDIVKYYDNEINHIAISNLIQRSNHHLENKVK